MADVWWTIFRAQGYRFMNCVIKNTAVESEFFINKKLLKEKKNAKANF